MPRLKDVVLPGARILFVGINPGFVSLSVGHHFAGKFNPFYELLHAARLVPVVLEAKDDQRLVEWGYGLTNLVPRATKMSTDLRRPELERGRKALAKKVKAWRPQIVALVGATLYPVVCQKPSKGGTVPGEKEDVLEGARVFVLPNPSGLNASYPTFADKVPWFVKLREFAATLSPPVSPSVPLPVPLPLPAVSETRTSASGTSTARTSASGTSTVRTSASGTSATRTSTARTSAVRTSAAKPRTKTST